MVLNILERYRQTASWDFQSQIHFILFFKFYFIFKLYIIVLVLPNIKMNPPQVYMCSPSWTLLPPPSPCHPSVFHRYVLCYVLIKHEENTSSRNIYNESLKTLTLELGKSGFRARHNFVFTLCWGNCLVYPNFHFLFSE